MENVNCLRCRFRHEDNGNCTAVGGFCTAVPAAYCPLLREYLDTELTPGLAQETAELAIWIHENGLEKIKEWIKADKEGCLIIATAPTADIAPPYMRWIDADEALRLFGEEYEKTKELIHNGETQLDSLAEGFTEAYHIIKYVLPTVDAVPVVRCKDCKHHYDCGVHFCNRLGMDCPNDSDFFCSYGERKDEKNN